MTARRTAVALLVLAAAVAAAGPDVAHAAAGPFGVGLPEPAPSAGGLLPSVFGRIAAWQSAFYRDLTQTLRAMKADGTAGFWLIGLSFLYGVLHAAGPGHGKAIVSAYVLANRETARNGAVLALVSALAQGVTAVALVSVAAVVLGATSIAMTRATEVFEIGSFALVTALGLWLVWRKVVMPLADVYAARFAPVAVTSAGFAIPVEDDHDHDHDHGHGRHRHGRGGAAHVHHHDHGHRHDHRHEHDRHLGHGHHHDHGHDHDHDHDHHHHGYGHAGGLACDCGHVHAASPALAAGRLDWRKAWTTVLAVGLRPCTGALIVLVFALSQGLFWAGAAAAFAMAVGTGLTVAALTLLAVGARGFAVRLGGDGSAAAERVHHVVEAIGAVLVLAFGVLMLGASLV